MSEIGLGEAHNYPLFFFVPKYRKSSKLDFEKQLKKRCPTYGKIVVHQCQKFRDDFCRHMDHRDDISLVVSTGIEYLKSFYGFVLEPKFAAPKQVDAEEVIANDDQETEGESETEEKKPVVPLDQMPISKLRYVIRTEFKNSLAKDIGNVRFQDSFYEASCALFNVMVGKMLIVNDLLTQKKFKDGFQRMRSICGICEFLEQCYFKDPYNKKAEVPFDMSGTCFSALKLMCFAQMNEIGVILTINKEKKHKMVAMLSRGVADLYLETMKKVEPTLQTKWKCKELECWVNYLRLKYQMYTLFYMTYNAVTCNVTDKNGEAMAIMDHVIDDISEMKKDLKKFLKGYWRNRTMQFAKDHVDYMEGQIRRQHKLFNDENNLIYHARKAEEIPDYLPSTKIGKSESWGLPDPSPQWSEYSMFKPKLKAFAEKDEVEEDDGVCTIL